MKNLRLTQVLIPTEDASILYLDNEYGKLHCLDYVTNNQYLYTNQHLYLCSALPIREGDWYYNSLTERIYRFGRVDVCVGENLKILFTTDSKLIADGVPAIDRNTKALVIQNKWAAHYEINLLSEFVKRWNEKDKTLPVINFKDASLEDMYERGFPRTNQKAVDVEKLIILERKNPTIYEVHKNQITQTEKLILSTQDKKFAERLVNGYNQAIQSNAGEFSLEDMRKAFFDGGIDLSSNKEDEVQFKEFIQSLTKHTSKVDFVIECEMDISKSMDKIKFPDKIKLKDGQPVLIFK